MNILPKKRWHVRTKENVARVRRDEAQAAEKEKAEAERAALAEQEFRTSLLRSKAAARGAIEDAFGDAPAAQPGPSGGPEASVNAAPITDATGHVNFFADLEQQERTFGSSKEHAEEKKNDKEAYERKIGLLKFLGEGSGQLTKDADKPFWMSKPSDRWTSTSGIKKLGIPDFMQRLQAQANEPAVKPEPVPVPKSESRKRKKEKKSKKEKKKSKKSRKHRSRSPSVDRKDRSSSRKSAKKEKKRRRYSSSSSSSSSEAGSALPPSNPNIEQLRAERLTREAAERAKTDALLRRAAGLPELKAEPKAADKPVYKQRYNSQFNPEFARQNAL